MAGAQGAVDSLLGRLTSVLLDEAQLLGGLRSDVEFIKDEMETMNGLLRHLTEAQNRNKLVWSWMKQVAGLARDCEGNVELYLHQVGGPVADPDAGNCLLQHLQRLLRLLRTLPARHRIAKRIRELKVRARDVGDRRTRYGITVPDSAAADTYGGDVQSPRAVAGEEKDLQRRAALFQPAPASDDEAAREGIDTLIKWLSREPPAATAVERDDGEPQVKVFSITGSKLALKVAAEVYKHPSVENLFGYKALATAPEFFNEVRTVLEKITCAEQGSRVQLKGKRFLIVITGVRVVQAWNHLLDALLRAADGCHPGSAIIMTTEYDQVVLSFSPYKVINLRSLFEFYANKAAVLNETCKYDYGDLFGHIGYPNSFAMKMFLHLLYVNPNRTPHELEKYRMDIVNCKLLAKSIEQKMVTLCYNELPSKYRSCLLYLTIFPKDHVIRATSLARRWIAEGFITTTARSNESDNAMDEAEHCLDVLFTRGFVNPVEISAEGNIKSCRVHHQVREFITRFAKDVNFVDMNLPSHHLSIHSRIGLQKPHSDGDSNGIIVDLLPSLAASSQWQLLKLLDLEGCKGLREHHLKSICKIVLLKYLSLRNTDVIELPKQIKELQCLETLDIRQTKIRMLARKAIVLPLLKHFLAGDKISAINYAGRSEEVFPAVHIPLCIQRMKNIEILSHIQVTHSNSELAGIAELLKLRKLGIVLHGKYVKLSELFCQIEKLHKCLRSLSIQMSQLADSENHDAGEVDALPSLPQFIESLNISGVSTGLRHLIRQAHHQLAKITLSENYFKENDLRILGMLRGLRCLRLQQKSYIESELNFRKDEFQSLNYLLVEGKDIIKINFVVGAAPKLESIVWSFATMEALSGLKHLPKLKNLELNGDCNLESIEEAFAKHPNQPTLKHKPHNQCQEDGTAVSASSLSAP